MIKRQVQALHHGKNFYPLKVSKEMTPNKKTPNKMTPEEMDQYVSERMSDMLGISMHTFQTLKTAGEGDLDARKRFSDAISKRLIEMYGVEQAIGFMLTMQDLNNE